MSETQTLTLTDFLLARIGEDEAVAREATPLPWLTPPGMAVRTETGYKVALRIQRPANRDHIARHDPARVLAECEAKRRIVAELIATRKALTLLPGGSGRLAVQYGLDASLRALALPYANHPDFRDEWLL